MTLPGGKTVEYVHDPFGRRIAKKINGVVVEKYLWRGLTQLLATYDGTDALTARFEYADDRMPVSMTRAGVRYFLAYDQVGTLRLVTDAPGNVVKKVDYDTFGNVIGDSAPGFAVPFGFAGGLADADTGLVHFGYRDYDPDTGRWTSKDPIRFGGGDTDLYGYCVNDPVGFVDPAGLYRLVGGTEEQREMVRRAAVLLKEKISSNACAQEFFGKSGRDVFEELEEGVGVRVHLGKEGDYYGEYNSLSQSMKIYNKAFADSKLAETLIHELSHHMFRFKSEIDPHSISCVDTFTNPDQTDTNEGYIAEKIVLNINY